MKLVISLTIVSVVLLDAAFAAVKVDDFKAWHTGLTTRVRELSKIFKGIHKENSDIVIKFSDELISQLRDLRNKLDSYEPTEKTVKLKEEKFLEYCKQSKGLLPYTVGECHYSTVTVKCCVPKGYKLPRASLDVELKERFEKMEKVIEAMRERAGKNMQKDSKAELQRILTFYDAVDRQETYSFEILKSLEKEFVSLCESLNVEKQVRYDKCHSSDGSVKCCVPEDVSLDVVLGDGTVVKEASYPKKLAGRKYDFYVNN